MVARVLLGLSRWNTNLEKLTLFKEKQIYSCALKIANHCCPEIDFHFENTLSNQETEDSLTE